MTIKNARGELFFFLSHQRPRHGSNSYFFFGLGFSLNFQIQAQENAIALLMLMLHYQQDFLRVAAVSRRRRLWSRHRLRFHGRGVNRLQQSHALKYISTTEIFRKITFAAS